MYVCTLADSDGLRGEPPAAGRAELQAVQGRERRGTQVSSSESQDGGRHLQQHSWNELQRRAGRHVRLPSGTPASRYSIYHSV